MYNEKKKKRVWMPKGRAETFKDRRTKRNRTRTDQKRKAIKEFKDD